MLLRPEKQNILDSIAAGPGDSSEVFDPSWEQPEGAKPEVEGPDYRTSFGGPPIKANSRAAGEVRASRQKSELECILGIRAVSDSGPNLP